MAVLVTSGIVMKRMVLVLVAVALLLLLMGGTDEAEADGMISPYQWEYPTIYTHIWQPPPPPPEKAYLKVEYHDVTVTIDENYAVTEVDQEFHNPYDYNMHGMYIFPVPEGAAISNFELIIDGKSYQATLLDGEEATRLLDEAMRANKDASLLEFKERDLFTYEIYIPAHESREVRLRYEELVPMRDGYFHYIYTLGTEQYSSAPIDHVSLTITMRSRNGFDEVFSTTHDIDTYWGSYTQTNGVYPYKDHYPKEIEVTYEELNARPDIDIEICYSHGPSEFNGQLYTNTTEEDGYFMFTFSPEGEVVEDRIIPKDVIFIIDQSGSMEGEKLEQTKLAMKGMLDQLTERDRFTILNYNAHVGYYSENLLSVTEMEITYAKRYVGQLTSQGGTDIELVLLKALAIQKDSQRQDALKVIIFLTDGRPTAGVTEEDRIVDHIGRANHMITGDTRIFVFGVGYNVNTHLLDRISKENLGESHYITNSDQIEPAITGFFERISAPVLTDVRVVFHGLRTTDMFPTIIPDVYVGSQLMLYGKFVDYGGGKEGRMDGLITITVSGRTVDGEASYTFTFDLAQCGEYEFIQRVWATRKIGHLLDIMRFSGESPKIIEEVRELGIEYNIVTPYTSFLAKAPEPVYHFPDWGNIEPIQRIVPYQNVIYADSGSDAIATSKYLNTLNQATYYDPERLFTAVDYYISPFPLRIVEPKFLDYETDKDDFYVLPESRYYQEPWTRTLNEDEADFYLRNLAIRAGDSSVTIIWDTTRLVEGGIFYRQLGTSDWETYWGGKSSLEHSLKINELAEGWYEFSICMMDDKGNLVIDGNGGDYHLFVIGQPGGSLIEHLTVEEQEGITIDWGTMVPTMGTVYYRKIGTFQFTNMNPELMPPELTRNHNNQLELESGEYEYYIASIDGDGQRFVDNNGGEYYSFSISATTEERNEIHREQTTAYHLMLGVILIGALLLFRSLLNQRVKDLADISSVESLNRHITHFASDPSMKYELIHLLLKKQIQPDMILSNAFPWLADNSSYG